MSTALAERPQQQGNVLAMQPHSYEFKMLDTYSPTGVTEIPASSADAIATISAGQKSDKGYPTASKDGRIVLHDPEGRAPGLRQALEFTGYKSLTITFPWDDPNLFIRQSFTLYSQTSLLIYGDAKQITDARDGQRRIYQAGTPQYLEALQQCKVSTFVFFHLARWTEHGAEVDMPDGWGYYRLRFTSRNSLRSILSSIQTVMRRTRGQIAGLPFELSIGYRDVPDAKNQRRTVAVWNCIVRPPEGFMLDSGSFRDVVQKSLDAGKMLELPAPTDEQIVAALEAGPDPDLDEITEAEVEQIQQGGICDVAHYRRRWFATVKDSHLASDKARAFYLSEYTDGNYESLSAFLETLSDEEASDFLTEVQMDVNCNDLARYNWAARFANYYDVRRRDDTTWPVLEREPRPEILQKGLSAVFGAIANMDKKPEPEPPAPSPKEIEPTSPRNLPTAIHEKVEAAHVDDDPQGSAVFETDPEQPALIADESVQTEHHFIPASEVQPHNTNVLTDAQHRAILALANRVFGHSATAEDFAGIVDKPIEQLTKGDASALIDRLRFMLAVQQGPGVAASIGIPTPAAKPPVEQMFDEVQEGEVVFTDVTAAVTKVARTESTMYVETTTDETTGEVTERANPSLPDYLKGIIDEALRQGLPCDVATINGPAMISINKVLVQGKKATVSELHDLKAGVVAFLLPKLVDGSLRWGAE